MLLNLFKLTPLLIAAALLFSTCGKRRPPLPPVERVKQRVEINGQQIGDRVDVYWQMPARNAGSGSTLRISRVDIYRLAEKLDDPLSLTEEEFSARSTLIGSLVIEDSDFGLSRKVYSDKLKIAGQAARLRYAVRFANEAGQKAAFSNFFVIEPAANVSVSPADISASVAQTAITIRWSAPAANLDGSSPANLIGYNVYRSSNDKAAVLLNEKPVPSVTFDDGTFEFGNSYRYFVRAVSLGRNAESVESFGSETIEVTPVDTFKPAPPEAVTIAAAPSEISIFFAFNLENDIAGYRVFRSTDPLQPKSDWQQLNQDLLDTNTFQDQSVVGGVIYHYFIVAVDTAGNVSDPSEVVSDTAL